MMINEYLDYLDYVIMIALMTGALSFGYFISLIRHLKKVKLFTSIRKFVALLLFSSLTSAFSFFYFGVQGYQALTEELPIAVISITPVSSQNYIARVQYKDNREETLQMFGDEIMFEADILKWKPWANILGLKTAYRLNRVRGRFRDIEDEKSKQASLFSISERKSLDIAEWRGQYQMLSVLLDVEHGSASYASAEEEKTYNLLVTTSGLLLRPAN